MIASSSRSATVFVVITFMTACASIVPNYDVAIDAETGAPTVRNIVDRVTCELAQALTATPNARSVFIDNDIEVAVQLSLSVTDTGSLTPALKFIDSPALSVNVGAKVQQSRQQNYFQKLFYSMRDLDKQITTHQRVGGRDIRVCPSEITTNLTGTLGIRENFELAMTSTSHLNWDSKLSGVDGAFGGFVEFNVEKNLNAVGPTWTLRRFQGPGGLAGLSRTNVDKISFAFAKGDAAGRPFAVSGKAKAERLLDQIVLNQVATQLSGIGALMR